MEVEPDEIDKCGMKIPKDIMNVEAKKSSKKSKNDFCNESEEELDQEDEDWDESDDEDWEKLEDENEEMEDISIDFEPDTSTVHEPFDDDPQFPENDETSDETLRRGFLEVTDPRNPNKKLMMQKTTYVWHLSEGSKKLSSDRTIRVQGTKDVCVPNFHDAAPILGNQAVISSQIKIGDWCVFKTDASTSGDSICIGAILAFKFAKGKTANEKKYKGDAVDLKVYETGTSKAKQLAVLSSWYNINESKHLMPVTKENHFFLTIDNYVATVAKPLIDEDTKTLFFSENDFEDIEKDILEILN